MIFRRGTPVQKEWEAFIKREKKALERYGCQRESFWEKRLSGLVPQGLSAKLEAAFEKAFRAVLAGGTGLIEKHIPGRNWNWNTGQEITKQD